MVETLALCLALAAASGASSRAAADPNASLAPKDGAAEPDAGAPRVPAAVSISAAAQIIPLANVQPVKARQTTVRAAATTANDDLVAAPEVQRTATFTFIPAYTASKSRLGLADVATCSGDARLCDEAYGIDLGPAPQPGRILPLEPNKILPLLTQEWPDAELRLAGAAHVRITSLAAGVQDETLVRQLQDALASLFPAEGTFAVTVERLSPAQPLKVRPGELVLTFPDLTPEHAADSGWVRKNLVGQKRLVATVQVKDDEAPKGGGDVAEDPAKAVTLNVRFGLKERLPVLNRDLQAKTVVGGADVTVALVDTCRISQRCAANAQELIGRRLTRPVPANEGVPLAATEVDQVIKRGQLVHLHMEASGLEVEAVLQAEGNAAIGETLVAVYPATKKKLHVRAVDSQTVDYVR